MSLADIIVTAVIAASALCAVLGVIVRKRKGKGCSCGCESCPHLCSKKK